MEKKIKVLAIASAGGHWVQLLRLKPAFSMYECVFVTTRSDYESIIDNNKFYSIPDFNRNSLKNVFKVILKITKIIIKEKPTCVISTGAAPGLSAIIIAKFFRKKTIWIDSIANVEKLSMSGKIASLFSNRIYTQWPHLATDKIMFSGNVIK